MKTILVALAISAILAPAALADKPAPSTTPKNAAGWCKLARANTDGWNLFVAKFHPSGGTYAATFGTNAKNGKTPLGKCVSMTAKKLAEAKQTQQNTTTPVLPSTTPAEHSVTDKCKAILDGKLPGPAGKSYKNLGECVKDKAGT